MVILNDAQIRLIIQRMAIQMLEKLDDAPIFLGGVNNKGFRLAGLIAEAMKIENARVFQIRLNASNPVGKDVEVGIEISDLQGQQLVIIDDVGNTGRTLFYAIKPFLDILPKSIQTGVLVERMHKKYPIQVEFVGLRLATTLGNNIEVSLDDEQFCAILE